LTIFFPFFQDFKMKMFQSQHLIAFLLLSVYSFASFAREDKTFIQDNIRAVTNVAMQGKEALDALIEQGEEDDSLLTPYHIDVPLSEEKYIGTSQKAKQAFSGSGKVVKEVYAARNMTLLNNANAYDRNLRLRTTADGTFLTGYGVNEKNPSVDAKMSLRLRYDVGTPALITTAPGTVSVSGVDLASSSVSIQKHIFWVRELFVRISLDNDPETSRHYVKFGSFPYELGRGISLGSAYASGGFLGLNPRFSIDQFAPGGLLHTEFIPDVLQGELYWSLLNNPSGSLEDNKAVIRANAITEFNNGGIRGLNQQAWIASAALSWKALALENVQLDIKPYTYMHVSPEQKLEFTADSSSQLYAIGTALEFNYDKFSWGFEGAFQGGSTNINAWDRNYTSLENRNGVVTAVYTKVYTDDTYTTKAVVTDVNKQAVTTCDKNYTQNGQEIGTSGLWNGVDRFRPQQKVFYHGYFFVTDFSYDILEKELSYIFDVGISSGSLDQYEQVNDMTQEQLLNQHQKYMTILFLTIF
jgi:hypothetical protein